MNRPIIEPLLSREEIARIVASLGDAINEHYAGREVVLLAILKGSVIFLADLMRELTVDTRVEFMSLSSYGSGTESSGRVRVELDLRESIEGKDVLIVEDILDTGRTLCHLLETLSARQPRSLEVVALLRKPSRHDSTAGARWVGRDMADHFVVGYGLDYDERYRNLPYIGILRTEAPTS